MGACNSSRWRSSCSFKKSSHCMTFKARFRFFAFSVVSIVRAFALLFLLVMCISSVHFSTKWYLCAREDPYALPPSLRSSPNVALETVPMLVRLTMVLFRPLKEDRWALPLSTPLLSPPGDRWCDELGFVPAGSVSSSSILEIFRDARYVVVALSASLSALSFPVISACPAWRV